MLAETIRKCPVSMIEELKLGGRGLELGGSFFPLAISICLGVENPEGPSEWSFPVSNPAGNMILHKQLNIYPATWDIMWI